ncbi:MAG: signal peptidase II [Chitinophagales bacterium]
MQFVLLAALVVALDQAAKAAVTRAVALGSVRPLIPGLLQVRLAHNTGAAFSLLAGRTPLLILIGVVAVAWLGWHLRRAGGESRWLRLGLALAGGGAVGNLLDRIRLGYVVDFFDLRGYPAIFNLADLAIVAGIGLLLIDLWREEARR